MASAAPGDQHTKEKGGLKASMEPLSLFIPVRLVQPKRSSANHTAFWSRITHLDPQCDQSPGSLDANGWPMVGGRGLVP